MAQWLKGLFMQTWQPVFNLQIPFRRKLAPKSCSLTPYMPLFAHYHTYNKNNFLLNKEKKKLWNFFVLATTVVFAIWADTNVTGQSSLGTRWELQSVTVHLPKGELDAPLPEVVGCRGQAKEEFFFFFWYTGTCFTHFKGMLTLSFGLC